LTDAAWALIAPMLPAAWPGGRPPKINICAVLNAIFPVRTRLKPLQHFHQSAQRGRIKFLPHRDPPTIGKNHFQCGDRSRIRIPVPLGQLHCNQPATCLCSPPSPEPCFLRCRRNVLSAIPRLRQKSLRRNPLASNSSTNRLTSSLLRRFRAGPSWFSFIQQVQHKNIFFTGLFEHCNFPSGPCSTFLLRNCLVPV
jgi:hypothetical protein